MKTKMKKFSLSLLLGVSVLVIGACGNGNSDASSGNDQYDTAIAEGKKAVSQEKYSEAKTAFNKALDAKAKDTKATTYLTQTKNYVAAEAAYDKGDLSDAKNQVEKVVREKKGLKELSKAGETLLATIKDVTTQQTTYQALYDDSQTQYTAEKLDEAAGTIDSLLEKDLSSPIFADLKQKAASLKAEINQAQAAKAKEEQAAVPDSKYTKERNSELIGKEFAAATGLDIKTASDDEIAAWLAEKAQNATANSNSDSSSADSSTTASSNSATTDSSVDSSAGTGNTITDAETIKVLQAVESITGISSHENEYYITKEGADLYQVEIRHSHTVDGTEISNMVGMFQYTPSSNGLNKMDPITGIYNPFKKVD